MTTAIPGSNDRPKHILHAIPTLASGGAERLLVTNLSNPALKEGFRHTVVLTDVTDPAREQPQTFLVKAIQDEGHEVIGLGRPGIRELVGCVRALRRLIREREIDLVHTHMNWSNAAGQIAGRSSGIPVFTTFHTTSYSPEAREAFAIPKAKFDTIRRVDGFLARRCLSMGIAVSQCVADHVRENLHLDAARLRVIHNPVDLNHVQPHYHHPRKFVFDELGLPESARVVIEVGRVLLSKGQMDLVAAFGTVRKAHPEAHLVFLGNQSDRPFVQRLREAADERGLASCVHFVDQRLDVGDFLAAADVFAFPSRYEGLGNAMLEAMSHGLPCIGSDIAPFREIIQDGHDGMIVPTGDVDALAKMIVRILDDRDLAKRLGSQAKIKVRENFHPDRKAKELADSYLAVPIRGRTRTPKARNRGHA